MSLSDHLRYLRARQGGTDTIEVAQAIGLESLRPLTWPKSNTALCMMRHW